MKDESLRLLGMCPSLHERTRIWSKSRFLVSRTPIIWVFTTGSPWNGMLVVDISCCISRCSVMLSAMRSPDDISPPSLTRSVCIQKRDSWKKASPSFALRAISVTMSASHCTIPAFSLMPNTRDNPLSSDSPSAVRLCPRSPESMSLSSLHLVEMKRE